MITQITNTRGNVIGFIDSLTSTYYTNRDFNKNEIFVHPKYQNAVGLSMFIIKQLLKNDTRKLCFLISNYEKEDFYAIIDLNDFLIKSQDVFFKGKYNSDKQKILPMKEFTRQYLSQMRLK